MINKELENVLEKLKELITEIELLIYPVRNIYDEHPELEETNENA